MDREPLVKADGDPTLAANTGTIMIAMWLIIVGLAMLGVVR